MRREGWSSGRDGSREVWQTCAVNCGSRCALRLRAREGEILGYLARGYKSSHIQQQLYISEGTAKTHIRHIYRKLNIHSQQDLIHLIDEVEL